MKLGAIIAVDEVGAPLDTVCEYGCPHTVYPIIRRNLVVIRKHHAPNPNDMGRWAGDPSWTPPLVEVTTALDTDGLEWQYEHSGAGTGWKSADGRTAGNTHPDGRINGQYRQQPPARGFIFTDTTGAPDVSH